MPSVINRITFGVSAVNSCQESAVSGSGISSGITSRQA